MTQNAMKLQWLPEEVDQKLLQIMHKIYADCKEYGYQDNGEINLIKGANIAAFQKIAHAMIDQGVI
jgi:glutamate dehydrogenase (NADP+)